MNKEGRKSRAEDSIQIEEPEPHSEDSERGIDNGLVKWQVAKWMSTVISAPFALEDRKHF